MTHRNTFADPCGCHKRRYRTWDDALHSLLIATRRRGTRLRIYPCPIKAGFHLTSLPEWKEPK